MRVAVVGARGQLGAAIVHEFSAGHEVTALGRADLDITNAAAIATTLGDARPDLIVNCAAYNDVDGAEDHPIDALTVNALAVRYIARAAAAANARLVHYSTDFVFDGAAAEPYREDDRPNPRSVYAASKLLGEWFAADAPGAYILRVESLFGRAPGGPVPKGSVQRMVDAIRAGREVRAFEDRVITPTYIVDAARATRLLVERAAPPGLYHCVNSGRCTWLELARVLSTRVGSDAPIVPVRAADVKMRALRPKFCALSNDKLRRHGIDMPPWDDALVRYLAVHAAC